ncbi:unnamed protein product [Heligmosomoides polygyrus]|uniref:Reverse transcriptase domain-containing protein n=1 Tax=Heligmosomoides polygyrus TaxID=6339 RepID=A0A183F3H4_HELPZ|nr:unnamed protein product [Heligmosomoides polygyrus]
MDAVTRDLQKPVPWTLPYAGDVMLASEDKDELELQVQAWCDRLARFGLKLNVKKTEYLTNDVSESGSIKINVVVVLLEICRAKVEKELTIGRRERTLITGNSESDSVWFITLRDRYGFPLTDSKLHQAL